jgi:hypothetical protein
LPDDFRWCRQCGLDFTSPPKVIERDAPARPALSIATRADLRERVVRYLGHLFAAVLETVSVVHGELLGEPSAELRAKLAGSDVPVLFTPYRSM